MTTAQGTRPQVEITFVGELVRKATHMGSLVIPGSYYWLGLSRLEMLCFIVPAALFAVIIDISRLRKWSIWTESAQKLFAPITRKHELEGSFTGASYILTTFCLCVALFDKPIAIAALAFIIVGDTFAALIGRRFGRHRFGRKSVEGSLGCLVGTLIVAWVIPDLSFAVAAFGAVVATVTEAVSNKIDDNVTVPLVSGTAMMLLSKILA